MTSTDRPDSPGSPACLRLLIVDDEPLAVERMQVLCAQIPGVQAVGTAMDGQSALRLARALQPDVLLLDIAMPEMDGLDVARALPADVPAQVIFVTAFDQFAVSAFDIEATDYLLKPVARARLERAIDRARARCNGGAAAASGGDGWCEAFWVPHGADIVRIAADDIRRIEAERDYMRLCLAERSYLIHETISKLEQRLDPAKFIRLHRSCIVQKDEIAALHHEGGGVWSAALHGGQRQRIGRSYLRAVKAFCQA